MLDELKQCIGFDQDDAESLRALAPLVRPHVSEITEDFMEMIWDDETTLSDEETKTRDDLKADVRCWIEGVVEGDYGTRYFNVRIERQRAHLEAGLDPHDLLAGIHFVRRRLVDVIRRSEDVSSETPLESLERLLSLERAIVVRAASDPDHPEPLEIGPALADGLAHEMRNPLNTIALQLTLLERRLDASSLKLDNQETIFETMRRELNRLEEVSTDLERVASAAELDRDWYDPELIFDTLTAHFALQMRDDDVELESSWPAGTRVYCDAAHVQRGLQFLIGVAKDTVEEPSLVEVELFHEDDHSIFEIDASHRGDTGGCLDDVPDAERRRRGAELSVAEEIARSHGGSVEYVSSVDSCMHLRLRLPRPDVQ